MARRQALHLTRRSPPSSRRAPTSPRTRRGKSLLLPAEKIFRECEPRDSGRRARLSIDFLIADHRGRREIDAVQLRELRDHAALGFAAFAFVVIDMRTDHPAGEDVAELTVEFHERGLDGLLL